MTPRGFIASDPIAQHKLGKETTRRTGRWLNLFFSALAVKFIGPIAGGPSSSRSVELAVTRGKNGQREVKA